MNDRDIEKVEQNLTALLAKKRHEAILFSLLTVALTPLVVAAISFFLGVIVLRLAYLSFPHYSAASQFYCGFSLFLGSMTGLVLMAQRPAPRTEEADKTWLLGAVLYILLLCLTYLTSVREQVPVLFGVFYAIAAFPILGLLGRAYLNGPVTTDTDVGASSGLLEVCGVLGPGFIVSAYAEVASASWLWLPPKPDEIRFAAWLLCALADDPDKPIDAGRVDRRLVRLLVRFKFVDVTDNQFTLSQEGSAIVQAAAEGNAATDTMR